MSIRFAGSLIVLAASTCFSLALVGPGSAQSVRKECSEKYQAAKAAGTLNGQAWPQFYSQCAAEAKGSAAAPAAAPAATPATPAAAPAAPAAANPLKPKPAAAPAAVGSAVFPSAVSSAYASEKPGKARMKTCLDQYNANKATKRQRRLEMDSKGRRLLQPMQCSP